MDLTYPIQYLSKLLAFKVCLRNDPSQFVESSLLKHCNITIKEIQNYFEIRIDYKSGTDKWIFYVTTSEKDISVEEPEDDWKQWTSVIKIGKSIGVLYEDPNIFSIKSICFDIAYSPSVFIKFRPVINSEQKRILHEALNGTGTSLQCPRLHKAELAYKICYGVVPAYKYIEFQHKNIDMGIETYFRKVI